MKLLNVILFVLIFGTLTPAKAEETEEAPSSNATTTCRYYKSFPQKCNGGGQ